MCLYPKLIFNPKYKANQKNGGIAPPMKDQRVAYVPIGCKKCLECKKQKAREWQVRLHEHIKKNTNGKFITLTFSNQKYSALLRMVRMGQSKLGNKSIPAGYDLDNKIATVATRYFLERWRKKYGRSLPHWLITELGHQGTENIHIHGIIWTNENLEEVEKKWKYGWVWKGKEIIKRDGKHIINYVNQSTISYITKYVTKIDRIHPGYSQIILTSPGIGNSYNKHNGNGMHNIYKDKHTDESYKTQSGHKLSLPIYYRNKIYTEEEREQLWLQKLDKQERWVLGKKISIKEGEENYNKALKYAQAHNKEMGYTDPQTEWNQKKYENERRILKQQERIKNTK